MSARFWLFSLASAGTALVSGLGLGLYATTPPRVAMNDVGPVLTATQDSRADVYPTDLNGPTDVKCSGCGPTLVQRQMVAMAGGWSGYDDAVAQDYAAQENDGAENLLPEQDDPPAPPVQQLPANIERFAAGEVLAAPEPVQFAQGRRAVAEDSVVPASGSQ